MIGRRPCFVKAYERTRPADQRGEPVVHNWAMGRGVAALVASSLLVGACSSTSGAPPVEPPTTGAPASTTPAAVPSPPEPLPPATPPPVPLPAPDQPIPTAPPALAEAVADTSDAVAGAIDRWREDGDPSTGQAPDDVVLLAMYQQRLYRHLGTHPDLLGRTVPLLPKRLRAEARADAGGAADLLSLLTNPVKDLGSFRTGKPRAAGVLRSWFEGAERRFGVRWELLAAVMFVESKFGRVRASSSAGAQGPMQFIPSTWARYGMGGDVHDPHDAILGAANYLHASGAPRDEREALFAYNHAWPYVDAVLAYADRMAADDRAFYAFYAWQVYVLTTSGVLRLTGPGR
jgi:soluble lytic murein transglycosylase-like protein